MINLSKRLKTIANIVKDNSKIIDIGCDHGLLDIYLVQSKKNVDIIASDVNKNALQNAIENIKKYQINNIETRLGNGLDTVTENEIDTIIISGMGTSTIIDILKKDTKKLSNVETMIIQSNNNIDSLRKEIVKLDYYINDEFLVEEKNIIYTIIEFKKGRRKYSNKEIFLGPILLQKKEEIFTKQCKINKDKLITILNKIPKRKIIYRNELKKKIKLYEMV